MANSRIDAPGAPGNEGHKQPRNKQDKSSARPPKIPLHQLYALPAPIRTFPLPSFYPNNPLSLFHVLWAWTNQLLSPPPAEPSVIHQGRWSLETRSAHIHDPLSIRALWEQGFFGKGSYSRSEPNWLKREQNRQGQGEKKVSELITAQRREERKMMKWDRARKEQEAILKTRLAEAWVAPVGPKELLALPNSLQDLQLSPFGLTNGHITSNISSNTILPDGQTGLTRETPPGTITTNATASPIVNGNSVGEDEKIPFPLLNGEITATEPATGAPDAVASTLKRRKSVRFSPTVESTTFQLSDPPASPHIKSLSNGKVSSIDVANESLRLSQSGEEVPTEMSDVPVATESSAASLDIVDREHLQLTMEETFYLTFGLGALTVVNPTTGKVMAVEELFPLFRRLSYDSPSTAVMRPDDPFLVQYAVYHHFRSLGWVPRPGIKFGVDWLLYIGGPVFAHAEFAVIVLPAYTDPYWKTHDHASPKRSWHWLHSINRVQTHALKTMVLVYVDIPPPTETSDPSSILKQYKIREFVMKRWLSNRSRE
ncbi:hypothetical protein F5B22DRAFT_618762 [Xylaria bambusicola]|uniref:uncharacterized protein n=1 Tax=Xylaria bambusicola TaxID=326684 RepID=UPI0020084ABA|nr:uncharacterized protein F5B22DRAFT_618762 [Xylaria bambusicola]KAI0508990.1 hypothetical protein F5B22DRAFT_618762 [Xylaria bambusicola]